MGLYWLWRVELIADGAFDQPRFLKYTPRLILNDERTRWAEANQRSAKGEGQGIIFRAARQL
jgi:hypothetical protein